MDFHFPSFKNLNFIPADLNNLSILLTNYILREYDDTKTLLYYICVRLLLIKPIMCKRSISLRLGGAWTMDICNPGPVLKGVLHFGVLAPLLLTIHITNIQLTCYFFNHYFMFSTEKYAWSPL